MSHKYVLLKEVCEKASSNIAQKDLAECDGIYPIYGASGYIKSVDFFQQAKDYIAIVKDGAGIGRAMKLPAKSSVIGTMQYILPNDNINISYLYYAICSMHLEKYFSGATIPHIYFRDYQNEQLPLPNLEEQAKIANVFVRIDCFIKKEKEQLINLDKLVKSRFIEMFGDIVLNDKHHGQYILNDVCVKITDGTHDTPKRIENGYLFLTGKNIRANGIIYDEIEYVSEEVHKEIYKRCNPEYGDVLYTNIGVNYGTACLNNRTDEFSMKNIALLKPNKKILNSYYLWYCLNLMRNFILEKNQAGGAQTFMGLATIKNIKIQVPSIELQNQFAAFVMQVDKSKFVVTAKFQ